MGYRNFRLNIIFRVLLLAFTIFVFVYVYEKQNYYITPFLIGILILVEVISLIFYTEKTNRDVANFLESIRYADFTRSFQIEGVGKSFDNLKRAFNSVITDFQKIRSEKEEHYFYIQNIIQHITICIVAFTKNGNVEMVNNAAKKMFQIHNLKNISQIEAFSTDLYQTLIGIRPGENRLVKVQEEDDLLQLAVYCTVFKIEEREIMLVSLKNIQAELEEQEMEAWQKLIRVLTHEIMNSIAPISSLAQTVDLMVKEMAVEIQENMSDRFDNERIDDIQNAIQTIQKRSSGLIHFVETYRNLTRIPKPNFTIFQVRQTFQRIQKLFQDDLKGGQIICCCKVEPENMEITVDENLIEQVLVNLVKNAIQALGGTKSPNLELRAFINKRGRTTIQIVDNGQGILKDVMDKIFIPFFTTKPTGSGIGLSLSRQIMRLHGGTITVQSTPEQETCFTLTF